MNLETMSDVNMCCIKENSENLLTQLLTAGVLHGGLHVAFRQQLEYESDKWASIYLIPALNSCI